MKINVKWEGDDVDDRSRSSESKSDSNESNQTSTEDSSLSLDNFEQTWNVSYDSTQQDVPKLKPLQRAALVIPLECCVDQFAIMKSIINEPIDVSWMKLFKYKTLKKRMETSLEKKRQLAEQEYERIPFTYRHKLKKEICFLFTTLAGTCREIINSGTFKTIDKVIGGIEREAEDNRQILDYEQTLHLQLKKINRTMQHEKHQHDLAMEQAVNVVASLKNLYEDIIGYSTCEMRYNTAWENARRSQLNRTLRNKEDIFSDTIKKYQWKIECEQRIHNEIENYINENIDDYHNSIQYWMQTYDEETERRDAEILNIKMEWEAMTEKHHLLEETYNKRALEMEEYLEIREKRRQQEELERLLNSAATKIQAWWRGTMVRKKLGPYGKKKKGKKDKKGGKGKKKKK